MSTDTPHSSLNRLNNTGLKILLSILVLLFLVQCSDNDDQREFERQAMQTSEGITETDASGALTGEHDPDDWRVAPYFQGLVVVDPAFPNPVLTNENVEIHILITGQRSVMGLEAYVLHDGEGFRQLDFIDQAPLPAGLSVIRFQAGRLGQTPNPESALGMNRVLVFDRNGDIITYGDILVE